MQPRARRVWTARILASTAGLAYASLLVVGLKVAYFAPSTPPAPMRVAIRMPATPQPVPSKSTLRARLPIEVPSLKPPQLPMPTLPLIEETLLRQTVAAEPSPSVMKPAPPAPPDSYAALRGRTYPETPGGPVMVMAALVDHLGHVLNVKVMVPSRHPVGDLTYLMSLPGTNIGAPVPPLPAGETRWIEIRFRYESLPLELP